MKILVYGAGGVGGYLGAKLWKAGHSLVFVARGSHLLALRQNGLMLESPEGGIHVEAEFRDTPDGAPPFDLIIISVKSFDTEEAATRCHPVVDDQTVVLSIQNGVENEELLGKILGDRHVIGGAAYIFSTIERTGVIRHHGGTTKFRIGEMDAPPGPRLSALQQSFAGAGIACEIVAELRKALWEKFIFITGAAGMTAYARRPIGKILADKSLHDMLSGVVQESAQVGRKIGIDAFTGAEERAEANFQKMPSESTSSMYYDITHGKRIEVEALNGAIVRFGQKYAVDVPRNTLIYNALLPYAAKG